MTADSRYESIEPVPVDTKAGRRTALFTTFEYWYPPAFGTYTVQLGDRWDKLAQQFLGDSTAWWALADMNPELFDPRSLRPGVVIRVPLS